MDSEKEYIEKINKFILKHEKKILIILIIISLSGIIFLANPNKTQWAQDSNWYISLTRNLIERKGYTLDGISPHGKYPIGLSVLIIPFAYIFKDVILGGLILIAILSLLSIILAYKIGKIINPLVGLLTSILMITSSTFIFYSVSILTEIPFMFFSIFSLYLLTKSFDKKIYIIPSLFFASLNILIRYDGFFLVFPFLYYMWGKRRNLKKFAFSKEFIIGVILFITPLALWFTRNLIAFGNPLYTQYAKDPVNLSIISMFSFLKQFFILGYLFPYLALFGLILLVFKKDVKIRIFLIWTFVYILLHMIWYFRVVRFYTEIFILICFFAAYGLFYLTSNLTKSKKSFLIFLILIMVVLIILQIYVFSFAEASHDESRYKNLYRYDPVKKISEFAEQLEDNADYVVSDVAVYSNYLGKESIVYYSEWIYRIINGNELNNNTYIFAETHHSWMTEPYLEGEKGQILLYLGTQNYQQFYLDIKTELIRKEEFNNKYYAILMKVKEVSLKSKSLIQNSVSY